ncbi:NUDIX hydrolase [Hymenobacter sp. UV11]|uniref:NUDIX domain-containing protein n=1 Tax=Hymenobacter sp. UV11 TaxID=1849735 RepID=UPI00105B82EC|nr:NUDIX hydrolase [Hymenobacter sp. UV11]TDN37993.1 GDP-mannose pyrophosphatase [Hymenobacter sp. UV11]TFZ65205.1 NUDIX hydrolase [Hymenobacter sp. UV11]
MQIVHRERAYDGHFKLNKLTVKTQEGQELLREQFAPGHAVAALVFDTQARQYVLTRQFRFGAERELLEIAAGMIDKNESPETAVRREIHEELGYEIDQLIPIVTMWPSPGTSAETIAVYYAEVSRQTGAGGGLAAENEQIEMVRLTREELIQEKLQDAKTLLAVQWTQLTK